MKLPLVAKQAGAVAAKVAKFIVKMSPWKVYEAYVYQAVIVQTGGAAGISGESSCIDVKVTGTTLASPKADVLLFGSCTDPQLANC